MYFCFDNEPAKRKLSPRNALHTLYTCKVYRCCPLHGWIEVGRFQTPRHMIPMHGRDKGVMSIGGESGDDPVYEIARAILQEARSLELLPADNGDD